MGRVIRTFITAGGYRGEGDLGVSTKAAHSGEGEAAGARMPARPLSPDTAAHRAKQGRNCWRFHDREKMASLLTAYQNPAGRRVYGRAPPGFFPCPSALGPSKVGAGASPQKAFGCQWQAKRSACPTRGWVKPASPPTVQVPTVHSLYCGGGLGLSCSLFCPPEASQGPQRHLPQRREQRPQSGLYLLEGAGRLPPPSIGPHSGPQVVTRGFPAFAGVSLHAGAPLPAPAPPAGWHSVHQLPLRWAGG